MRIAIEGCTHGELEKIYATIQEIENREGYKVDLLICCGDFQSTRNLADLKCMACPDKYKEMCSFYKYYAGEAIAPMLTIFIGGNHEASNYLQELAYGGWVAPNIYYLGYAGVVEVNGVRIGGLSGIFKGFDYLHGHHEKPPYGDDTMRSCYHIRNLDVFRLKQLADNSPQIMLSHDWPRGVTSYGNVEQLMRFKRHFKDDIEQDKLGSGPTREVLDTLQPDYWFAAHLHCKFAALVPHESGKRTKFLALDKCLPGRQFLQVLEIGPEVKNDEVNLRYDRNWLAVLRSTNHLLSVEKKNRYTPGPGCSERYDFRPTAEELAEIDQLFGNDFDIPYNFEQSVLAYRPTGNRPNFSQISQPQATTNKQTTELCGRLQIFDPMALLIGSSPAHQPRPPTAYSLLNYVNERESNLSMNSTFNPDEISVSTEEEEEKVVQEEQESEAAAKDSGTQEESKVPRAPMSIPAPQLDSDDVDLVSILNTSTDMGANSCSFVEDREGSQEHSISNSATEPSHVTADATPAKKLKRRNAALYTPATEGEP